MDSKYPKAGLWRMLKLELLAIADSEPAVVVDKKMTRAQIIGEILKVEATSPLAEMSATEAPGIAGVVLGQSVPALPDYEEEDMTPASARIRRIRQASK